jgi:two-component system sensor histidine kinase KdpD
MTEPPRPTADALLARIKDRDRARLRIYVGAAPGVGKTYEMLREAHALRARGLDVVVGYVETYGRVETAAQLKDLEVIPRRKVDYRGVTMEEMDVGAVLARRPQVCVVDELAHTNVPGSRNSKRWQDVEELLDAGIDVITTLNIQHLESVNDVVEQITGVRQRETIPDEIVRRADQIELVDMTPEALRRRMAHGNIYKPEKVDAALGNYFRVGNLAALREIALLWVADRVDEALEQYRATHGISQPWETRERVVVAVTGAPSGEQLIRRAARMAQRSHGELLGVHVQSGDGLSGPPSELLERHRRLLADLGGEYHEVVGGDVARALTQFARSENATQLVMGATRRSRLNELTQGSVINRVLRDSGPIDVHVISYDPDEDETQRRLPTKRRLPVLSQRRRITGWAIGLAGAPLLTLVLHNLRGHLTLAADMVLYLLLVTIVAVVGGRLPALVTAAVASLLVNWFFTPPYYTFTITETSNVVAVTVFLAVAIIVGQLVSVVVRRSADALRARAEAEALARVAGGLLGEPDAPVALLAHLRSTFDIDAAAVLRPTDSGWSVDAVSGSPIPSSPAGHESLELIDDAQLVLVGPGLAADDRRVLQAFVAQLDAALEHRRLAEQAAGADALAEADYLRTAILRAVSHDLRTPLSSIKAAATSLLEADVEWSTDDRQDFLHTIDEETDRLNRLVGNLLDMSRLEAGAVHAQVQPVALEEVVPLALAGLGARERLVVTVPETLPQVLADPALLERSLANLTANALRYSPVDRTVRVEAGAIGTRIDLRVIDSGPGVPPAQRDQVFEPFQRLGDNPTDAGVGLGLAVARGFVRALGGELELDDTPGGGLTAVISLPRAEEPSKQMVPA